MAPEDKASSDDKASNQDFRTLDGFLMGDEPSQEIYFAYSASLRICGDIPDFDELTNQLGIEPTHIHHCGERRRTGSRPHKQDMWIYAAPIEETEPLHAHIDALWKAVRPRKHYVLQLKQTLKVDVFLGYRTNCDHAGIEVPHSSLEMFIELQVPFGVSIIIT